MRLAPSSLGSLVRGLLHRSMVLAAALVALPHQVSHHSHSCACQMQLVKCSSGHKLWPVTMRISVVNHSHSCAEGLDTSKLPSKGKGCSLGDNTAQGLTPQALQHCAIGQMQATPPASPHW